jgi:hypothetical protein
MLQHSEAIEAARTLKLSSSSAAPFKFLIPSLGMCVEPHGRAPRRKRRGPDDFGTGEECSYAAHRLSRTPPGTTLPMAEVAHALPATARSYMGNTPRGRTHLPLFAYSPRHPWSLLGYLMDVALHDLFDLGMKRSYAFSGRHNSDLGSRVGLSPSVRAAK